MGFLKDTITDYIYEFKAKDARGRLKEIRSLSLKAILVFLLICTPWIVSHVHERLARHLYEVNVHDLTQEQRWQRVRDGLDRIDCDEDAAQKVAKRGLDLSTPDGTEYAIQNDWCHFVINDQRPAAAAHMFLP